MKTLAGFFLVSLSLFTLTYSEAIGASNSPLEDSSLPKSSVRVGDSTLSVGGMGTCVILNSGQVLCSSTVPKLSNVPIGLSRSIAVSVGSGSACAISEQKDLTCWGQDIEIVDNYPDSGKFTSVSVGERHACSVTELKLVMCWGEDGYEQATVPDALGEVKQVSVGGLHTCVLTTIGNISCWGGNDWGQADVPRNEGPIQGPYRQVSAGGAHTCAVNLVGRVRCWGLNDRGQTEISNSVTATIVRAGYASTCLVRDDGSRPKYGNVMCWGSNSGGKINVPQNLYAADISTSWYSSCAIVPYGKSTCWGDNHWLNFVNSSKSEVLLPDNPKSFRISGTNGNQIRLAFEHVSKPTDDIINWTIKDTISGKTYCQLGNAGSFWVEDAPFGQSYQFNLVGSNDAGSTNPVVLELYRHCANNPSITAAANPAVAINGSLTTMSGSVVNMCYSPTKVLFRFKEPAKSWSNWTNYPLTKSKSFSVSRKFHGRTLFQFKVIDGPKTYQTGELEAKMRIKRALPLSFAWKPAKNSQGFNQGGTISVSFSGDKEFNGNCTVSASTERAYNFALTLMGSEAKYTQFKVSNGSGSGVISMRWNGVAKVGALCKDPKFIEIYDFRNATFKANF